MIGLNEELAARQAAGDPVRIGMIGAGQMGVDIVAQVAMMKGIDIVAVADIDKARAQAAYATGLLPPSVDPWQRAFLTDVLGFPEVDYGEEPLAIADVERHPDVRRVTLSSTCQTRMPPPGRSASYS